MNATRPWQARILPARPNPPSPILPLTPTSKRPCQSVHYMYPYSCPTCAPGQYTRSSMIESLGCTRSLVRPVTATHVSHPKIPSLHFLVYTGFQIPSCLSSTIKRPKHRSFWCLFGLVEKTPCTIVHAVPPIQSHLFLYLSLPNLSLASRLRKLGVFAKSFAVSYWPVSIPPLSHL